MEIGLINEEGGTCEGAKQEEEVGKTINENEVGREIVKWGRMEMLIVQKITSREVKIQPSGLRHL